ncbi:SDR family oxidoreductase [Candidatus Pelagibacter sp.]|nr:SDR family oxidoreductase [Candidatus Pelagibacter sp.]
MKKKIIITGGLGYIGIELAKVLSKKYSIVLCDINIFQTKINKISKKIKILLKDFRDLNTSDLKNVYSVIHLASISNDPSVLLDPKISWEVNVLGTFQLLNICKKAKIKKFIFASSGSVYGVKKEKKVTEDLDLVPISEYNKTKMIGERVIMSFNKYFTTSIIRPATVCGYSEALRLDVSVNMLTFQALHKKKITVFGGKQYRPNIHIKDMIRLYSHFLKKNINGIFNAGFENLSINHIVDRIKQKVKKKIIITKLKTNDIRSYRLSSKKLEKVGFKPKYNVSDAIEELTQLYNQNKIKNLPKFYRVNFLKNKINKVFKKSNNK